MIPLQNWNLPINIPLCVAGLLSNLLCIAVLTRRNMRSSFNTLLLCLALTDFLGLGFYLAAILSRDAHPNCCETLSGFAMIITVEMICTFLINNLNMWLTLSITMIRYIAISQMSFRFSIKQARYVVLSVLCISLVHKTPSFALSVKESIDDRDTTQDRSILDEASLNPASYINYILDCVAIVLLGIFSSLIISVLYKGTQRHKKITRADARGSVWDQATRTTATILGITVSTTLCKIVVLFNTICYLHFPHDRGDYTGPCGQMDYAAMIKKSIQIANSGINIAFFVVSKEFRNTLKQVILCRNI